MPSITHLRRLALVTGIALAGVLDASGAAFAGTVADINGTTLQYTGSNADDTLKVSRGVGPAGETVELDATGDDLTGDGGCVQTDLKGDGDQDLVCTSAGVSNGLGYDYNAVGIDTGDGKDTIDATSLNLDTSVLAGDGDDTITGGDGYDTLEGGAGDDTIKGGNSSDQIFGGLGKDRLDGGGDGDQVRGGADDDTITVSGSNHFGESNYGEAGNDTLDARGADPGAWYGNLYGGDGNDALNTGDGSFNGYGEGDDDVLVSGAGDYNSLDGGDGDDTLTGAGKYDYLSGAAGDDVLTGGGSNDSLEGGEGADTIDAGSGDDYINGGTHREEQPAGSGNWVGSQEGSDTVHGGSGWDRFTYEDRTLPVTIDLNTPGGDGETGENDSIAADVEEFRGGQGNDRMIGNAQPNWLDGYGGDDTIDGRGGFDLMFGSDGSDTITGTGDEWSDYVDCGNMPGDPVTDVANIDWLDNTSPMTSCTTVNRQPKPAVTPTPTSVDPDPTLEIPGVQNPPTAPGTTTTIVVERESPAKLDCRVGTDADDVCVGDAAANLLGGGKGADVLRGAGGDDDLRGGEGADRLYGQAGNDVIAGGDGDDRLTGMKGDDTLDGGRGDDTLRGTSGHDALIGGPGRDNLNGGAGADMLNARDGHPGDTVTCSRIRRMRQRDVVLADAGDTIVNRRFCAQVQLP